MACVAAPSIGGPRPLPGVTTHPLTPDTPISSTYCTLKREELSNESPHHTASSARITIQPQTVHQGWNCLPAHRAVPTIVSGNAAPSFLEVSSSPCHLWRHWCRSVLQNYCESKENRESPKK